MSKKKNPSHEMRKDAAGSLHTGKSGGFPSYFSNATLMSVKLFLISVLLYAGTLGHGFVQDDAIVITDNDFTKNGDWASLWNYDTFRGFFKQEGKAGLVEGGRYRPLTPMLFALVWKVSPGQPFLFHLLAVLSYGGLVVLLFLVLLKLLSHTGRMPYSYFVAFVSALVFAIHPVHTEVVANIKGMDEIFSLGLGLLALYLSLLAHQGDRYNYWVMAGAGLAFLLALLAKEMAVVLIPVVALAFYVFRKMNLPNALLQTLPYLLAFGAFWFRRGQVLGDAASSGPSMELMNHPYLKIVGNQWVAFSFSEKFGTIFYTLGKYIQLLVFPYELTHDYYPYAIPITELSEPIAAFSLLAYLALAVLAAWGVLRRKHWGFGIAFFLTALFLVSNIPLVIGVNMAERFLFMPSVGFCLLVGIGAYYLCERMNGGEIRAYRQFKPAMVALAVVFLLGGYKTYTRSLDWKSNDALFAADWKKSADSAKIRNARGGSLVDMSQKEGIKGTAGEKEMLKEAIMHLNAATKIHPTYKGAYLLKGNAQLYLGQYSEAIQSYDRAIQVAPGFEDAITNRQVALDARANAQQQEGITQQENQAIAASQRGDFAEAMRLFGRLAQQYPKEPKYHYFIGVAKIGAGDTQGALEQFLQAEQKDPGTDITNTNRILNSIAETYTKLGQADQAAEYRAKMK